MKILGTLTDEEFPKRTITETRNVARALVYDDEGLFSFHHLCGDDAFGHRDYLETPGGGVENGESFETGVVRECLEELGYKVEVIAPLGEVIDYYNLIGRKNINKYFLCHKVGNFLGLHFVSLGDRIIKETLSLPLAKALSLYKNYATTPIARLVYNRESLVIEELMRTFPSFK